MRNFIVRPTQKTESDLNMALLITDKCINCDMCDPECPNGAISMGESIFEIDPALCRCKGHRKPTCQSVCPINKCIVVDPDHVETEDELLEKFVIIQGYLILYPSTNSC